MTGLGPFIIVVRTYCIEMRTPQSVAVNVCISYNRTSAFVNVFQKMRNNFVCL